MSTASGATGTQRPSKQGITPAIAKVGVIAGLLIMVAGVFAIVQEAGGARTWYEAISGRPPSVEQTARQGQTINPYRYEPGDWSAPTPPAESAEYRISVPHETERQYRELIIRLVLHHNGRIDRWNSGPTEHMRGNYQLTVYANDSATARIQELAGLAEDDETAHRHWAQAIPVAPVPSDPSDLGLHAIRVHIEETARPSHVLGPVGQRLPVGGMAMMVAGLIIAIVSQAAHRLVPSSAESARLPD